MAEDTHSAWHAGDARDGGDAAPQDAPRDLLCPTCERPFGPSAARSGPTAPLVEPIPDKPPLLWLKVTLVAVGAAILLGGSALAAYRAGVSTGQTEGARTAPSDASAPVSADTSAPASWDASSAGAWESSMTTPPTGSMLPTMPAGSMDASLAARMRSLNESLASGGGGSGYGGSGYGGMPYGGTGYGGTSGPYMGFDSGAAGGSSGYGGSSAYGGTTRSGGASGASGQAGAPKGPAGGETDLSASASISASSQLSSARGFTYGPRNLVDGRGDTCWAEGAAGYGIGQSVTFDFGREVVITRLEVLPGYDKFFEVDRWSSNGRLKAATLRGDAGSHPITLSDQRSYQSIAVPSLKTRRLTIVISSAYPATPGLHSASDTSIGELRVYGR